MGNDVIFRKPLLSATFASRSIDSVEVKEITFKPGQKTGLHKHPCPVLSYIAEGTALVQVEGEEPKIEHFPCCRGSRNGRAAAFSLRKTPMKVAALDYTHRENALLAAGSAVYEPADTVMLHFDNASETEPLRFIAF